MRRRALVLGAFVACVACRGAEPSSSETPDLAPRSTAEIDSVGVDADGPRVSMVNGVPHPTTIVEIAIAPDGKAALSKDGFGGLRLWTDLKGEVEPRVVPVRESTGMSIASREGGYTLALVDGSGGARVLDADTARGEVNVVASLPPDPPLAALEVLPGGKHLLALGTDHVVRLLDLEGRELAQLSKRKFRPAQLRVVDGGTVVALEVESRKPKSNETAAATVRVHRLEVGDKSLAVTGTPRELEVSTPVDERSVLVSPDGRTVVHLERGLGKRGTRWDVVATQLESGNARRVKVELRSGQIPQLTLLSKGRVLFDDLNGGGRVVDLATGKSTPRLVRMQGSVTPNRSVAAAGTRVAPAGTWLQVHDLDTDETHYIGHQQLAAAVGAVDHKGEHIAWASGAKVYVEEVGTGRIVESESPNHDGMIQFLTFVDDAHVAAGDWNGALRISRWADGEVVHDVDFGGRLQEGKYDPESGLLIVRSDVWDRPVVTHLSPEGIGPRYVFQREVSWFGVMPAQSGQVAKVWTADTQRKWRSFSYAETGAGVDETMLEARAKAIPSNAHEQVELGPGGRTYTVQTAGGAPARAVVFRFDGDKETGKVTLEASVSRLHLAPDGEHLAVVHGVGGNVVSVIDTETMETAWSRRLETAHNLSWSGDGSRLLIVGNPGGILLTDADNGEKLHGRCGLQFSRRSAPPAGQPFASQPSVCEI